MRRVAVLVVILLGGCGDSDPPAPAPTATVPVLAMPAAPPLEDGAELRVRAVDLDGKPVAGVVPIVTRTPNATDYPLANGAPSGKDGYSTIAVPVAERVYLRMWDPAFRMFANNYFDVELGRERPKQVLQITMVPGVSLRATLVGSDEQPAAFENVGLMMFHPTKGAWWPAEADTDAAGVALFPHVPAGVYAVKIKTSRSGAIDLPTVTLSPGTVVDLGVVRLTPASGG
jgi:hypothetical protein